MNRIPLLIPPLHEQRAIADILGTLDDKIEINRRMSGTLEMMARALFKSWFVDFDPVRAKMKGRAPGLPQPLANLFPDRLVDSEIGQIPAGWSIEALSDHFEAVKGVSYKGSGLGDEGVPLHNLNSIYEGGGYKYEGIKRYSGEYRERHIVRPGDVIVANTEQGHDRLLIGYAAIVPSRFGNHGIASHHIYRMRPKHDSSLTAAYLCCLLNSVEMHDVVSGYANGTTVNMLPIDAVQRPLILHPPAPLVEAFDSVAVGSQRRCEEIVSESLTLATLRDTLLPKLISGELRVNHAEELLNQVTA
jgi:type I restriction enzyme S subunit